MYFYIYVNILSDTMNVKVVCSSNFKKPEDVDKVVHKVLKMFKKYFVKRECPINKDSDMDCVYLYNGLSNEQLRMLKNLLKSNKSVLQFKKIVIDDKSSTKTSPDSDSNSSSSSDSSSDSESDSDASVDFKTPTLDSDNSDSSDKEYMNSDSEDSENSECGARPDQDKLDAIILDLQRITQQIREMKK